MANESGRDRRSGRTRGSAQNPGSGGTVQPNGTINPSRTVEPAAEAQPAQTIEPAADAQPAQTIEPAGKTEPRRSPPPAVQVAPGGELEPAPDFDAFYEATRRRTVGQVYAMCGNLHEAEDCVQEAFARAWQRWPALSAGPGDPEAWVRTVAIRLAVSSWRKAVNRLLAHRREAEVTGVPGMNPDHVAVVAALRRISADQRLAIVLQHYGGLSVEEIAAQTGASASAVKARLARGRAALAPHLTEFAQSLEEPHRPPPRNRPEFSRTRSRSQSRQEI
jgi:RNA polymerase sigma-70 factor (sigma-E family)